MHVLHTITGGLFCFSAVSEPASGVPNYLRSMYEYVKTLHSLRAEIAGVRKGKRDDANVSGKPYNFRYM